MAKKTVKVGLRSSGSEPAAGDVNISYKGTRIAGLSESSTAVLETENTIVQDDIEIEYTKPATVYSRTLTINGNDNFDWHFRIPALARIVEQGFIATWDALGPDIVVLTGDAEKVVALVESTAGAEGSKTHPYDITGSCVTNYNRTTGRLILDPNADTFEISIVATNE